MEQYDVVIVGAGPSGLKCAEVLAENGKRVVVLEKNKIIGDKVCAGGLTIKDLELGIPNKIIERKFNKVIAHTPLQKVEIKSEKPFLATINRKDLGKWMEDNAKKAGAEIRLNSIVTQIKNKFVVVNGKDVVSYKYLIGADGANSIVRQFLGIKKADFAEAFQYLFPGKLKDLEFFLNSKKFGPCYAWIFPHKNFFSIGGGGDLSKRFSKPPIGPSISKIRENFDYWCKEQGLDISKAKFEASIINYDYKGHEFGNKFLIGEAGGFISGLTCEGIYPAIKSGEDVAKKILDKKYVCTNIKHILEAKKREEFFGRTLEINRAWTEVEDELFILLCRFKWIDSELIKDLSKGL